MEPNWGRQDPGGPHVGRMSLDNWVFREIQLPLIDLIDMVVIAIPGVALEVSFDTFMTFVFHSYVTVMCFECSKADDPDHSLPLPEIFNDAVDFSFVVYYKLFLTDCIFTTNIYYV